jgi:hypothetical protein
LMKTLMLQETWCLFMVTAFFTSKSRIHTGSDSGVLPTVSFVW